MYTPEELDIAKTKVLKYVLYKKRTKQEVRSKFYSTIEEEMLEKIIDQLEENGYLNDQNYVERAITELQALQHLSLKEIQYKLLSKGTPKELIENYIAEHSEELLEYEFDSAVTIAIKKSRTMEQKEIEQFLYKKGYLEESIRYALKKIIQEDNF